MKIVNVFLLLNIAFCIWQLNDALLRISATAQIADTWDSMLSAAWVMVSPLTMHFTLSYCGILTNRNSRTYLSLLYFPTVVLALIYQSHIYPHNLVYSTLWGWENPHDGAVADMLLVAWLALLVLAATVIMALHTYSIRYNRLYRRQSLLITIGIAIPSLSGIITQAIFPIAMQTEAIPITSTFMTFFSITTVIALTKYQLFDPGELISDERLISAIPFVTISISEDLRVNYINEHGAAILGVSKQEMLHHKIDELIKHGNERDHETLINACMQALAGQSVRNLELSLVTSSGLGHVLLTVSPIVNNKRIVGGLLCMRDVTEIKQSNDLIRKNAALLTEAQEIANMGSWEWDMSKSEIIWSEQLYKIYHHTSSFVTLQSFLEHIHPADRSNALNVIQHTIRTGEPYELIHRPAYSKGDERILLARGQITLDENGKPTRMTGTCQDVTESKQKEVLLKRQNEELKKVNAELDKFVYSVSHDLRSPLTSILGIINIAQAEDKQENVYYLLIKEAVLKLDNFITDILNYSRNARTAAEVNEIDFQAMIKSIVKDHQYANEGIQFLIQIQEREDQPFHSDARRLAVVLGNLVSNAVRYSDRSKDQSYVRLDVNYEKNHAIITIEDNGLGIRKEELSNIFDMFYRGSNSQNGSGLGLYIVKETVEKLNGNIKVFSEQKAGTKFVLTLPDLKYEPTKL